MPHNVLMPQLGMAQDKAVLLSWNKTIGDAVKIGEILMEVETDKSTVEVEASYDGFLVDIRADAGTEVPVGNVVAIISENVDDVVAVSSETDPSVEEEGESTPDLEVQTPISSPSIVIQNSTGIERILASPKAKMEAKRSGVDLAALVQSGVSEPVHFDDVVSASVVSEAPVATSIIPAVLPVFGLLSLKIPRKPMDEFTQWLEAERPGEIDPSVLWMSLVTRAARSCSCFDPETKISCAYQAITSSEGPQAAIDADRTLLSSIQTAAVERPGQLEIINLTGSEITEIDFGPQDVPISIVLKSTEKNFKIRCTFDFQSVTKDQVIQLSSHLAQVLANPISLLV